VVLNAKREPTCGLMCAYIEKLPTSGHAVFFYICLGKRTASQRAAGNMHSRNAVGQCGVAFIQHTRNIV